MNEHFGFVAMTVDLAGSEFCSWLAFRTSSLFFSMLTNYTLARGLFFLAIFPQIRPALVFDCLF